MIESQIITPFKQSVDGNPVTLSSAGYGFMLEPVRGHLVQPLRFELVKPGQAVEARDVFDGHWYSEQFNGIRYYPVDKDNLPDGMVNKTWRELSFILHVAKSESELILPNTRTLAPMPMTFNDRDYLFTGEIFYDGPVDENNEPFVEADITVSGLRRFHAHLTKWGDFDFLPVAWAGSTYRARVGLALYENPERLSTRNVSNMQPGKLVYGDWVDLNVGSPFGSVASMDVGDCFAVASPFLEVERLTGVAEPEIRFSLSFNGSGY